MALRSIPSSMDAGIISKIDERLSLLQEKERIDILWAIESGSRAWGFPSPDSDYDCRFIFRRSFNEYLSPWHPRDVIETPLDVIYDVNGWDITKALRLLVGGNAVIIEWMTSPIIYMGQEVFQKNFLELIKAVAQRDAVAYHYLSLGRSMLKRLLAHGDQLSQKKIFYALRPAMALRWLRQHENSTIAPMNFITLMEQSDLPYKLVEEIQILLDKKSKSREMGSALLLPLLHAFIENEFSQAERLFPERKRAKNSLPDIRAEEFFRNLVQERML